MNTPNDEKYELVARAMLGDPEALRKYQRVNTAGPLIERLNKQRRRWRRLALLFATLLIACLIVIILQIAKLP